MNADKLLAAEQVVVVAVVATDDLLSQGSSRGLPSPRRIIGAVVFYGALSLVASLGNGPARVASAVGALVALVTLVAGVGARALPTLLGNFAAFASTPATGPTVNASGGASTGAGSGVGQGILKAARGVGGVFVGSGGGTAASGSGTSSGGAGGAGGAF